MNAHRFSNERGASAVEFAVIAPLLMLIIVAVIEFGLLLNRIQVYESAARAMLPAVVKPSTNFMLKFDV